MPTRIVKNQKKAVGENKPIEMSIWDVLENPLFEKNLEEEMKLTKYYGDNYAQLKEQVEQQYRQSLASLEMAKDLQMKELLKDYSKPDDLTVKYVEVMTKKSRLSRHKRDLISMFFGPLIKNTAIQIINAKEEQEKCKSESQESPKEA